MHRHAPDMAVFDRLGEHGDGEVFRALAGVKGAAAQVDRVGAVLNGRLQRFHGSGGSQKFQHSVFSPYGILGNSIAYPGPNFQSGL